LLGLAHLAYPPVLMILFPCYSFYVGEVPRLLPWCELDFFANGFPFSHFPMKVICELRIEFAYAIRIVSVVNYLKGAL
jgi:hypothetical protein